MALDNGTIQHPLPGDLQARVENALNLVTSLEAEQNRLAKLIGSMKADVNSLHEEKKSVEIQLQSLKAANAIALNEVSKSEKILADITNEISEAKANLIVLKDQAVELTDKINADKEANLERIKRIEDTEADVNKRASFLAIKETEHEARVQRIREAIK